MVHEIIKSRKVRIFLEVFFLTFVMVVGGLLLGIIIESNRANQVIDQYKQLEVNALDLKLQNYYYEIMDKASCTQAINQNFIFADKIYNEGLIIQQYEAAEKLSDQLKLDEQRYALLKTELWINSILLKDKCNNPFHTVVYLFSQDNSPTKSAEQAAISKTLEKIKQEKGNSIILIPIAGDLGLDSVDMQERIYNVTYLPSIVIDEKYVLPGFVPESQINQYLN
jgi:hypothetical protein